MNKKGILDTVMSWLMFAFYVLTIVMVMSLCGCATTCKADVASGISTDNSGIAELRASEQLSAYLRTDMPDAATLNGLIDNIEGSLFLASNGINTAKARTFLNEHSGIYVDNDYGGFLSGLYFYSTDEKTKDDAKNAFRTVTNAMFARQLFSNKIKVLPSGELGQLYYTPFFSVKFGHKPNFDYENGDWLSADPFSISRNFVSGNAFKNSPTAFKIIPAADRGELTVQLKLYNEEDAQPTP